jgi:hypothetical protein
MHRAKKYKVSFLIGCGAGVRPSALAGNTIIHELHQGKHDIMAIKSPRIGRARIIPHQYLGRFGLSLSRRGIDVLNLISETFLKENETNVISDGSLLHLEDPDIFDKLLPIM